MSGHVLLLSFKHHSISQFLLFLLSFFFFFFKKNLSPDHINLFMLEYDNYSFSSLPFSLLSLFYLFIYFLFFSFFDKLWVKLLD